jgi:hypothetical protein
MAGELDISHDSCEAIFNTEFWNDLSLIQATSTFTRTAQNQKNNACLLFITYRNLQKQKETYKE